MAHAVYAFLVVRFEGADFSSLAVEDDAFEKLGIVWVYIHASADAHAATAGADTTAEADAHARFDLTVFPHDLFAGC